MPEYILIYDIKYDKSDTDDAAESFLAEMKKLHDALIGSTNSDLPSVSQWGENFTQYLWIHFKK